MAAYQLRLDLSAVAAYPGTPQVILPFQPHSVAIVIEDDPASATDAAVSFDGSTDHATLIGGRPSASLYWEPARFTRIWLKAYTTGATSVVVFAD